jgi:hypothetical protein
VRVTPAGLEQLPADNAAPTGAEFGRAPGSRTIVERIRAVVAAKNLMTDMGGVELGSALSADFAGTRFRLLPRHHLPVGSAATCVTAEDLTHVVIEGEKSIAVLAMIKKCSIRSAHF